MRKHNDKADERYVPFKITAVDKDGEPLAAALDGKYKTGIFRLKAAAGCRHRPSATNFWENCRKRRKDFASKQSPALPENERKQAKTCSERLSGKTTFAL